MEAGPRTIWINASAPQDEAIELLTRRRVYKQQQAETEGNEHA